jgi:hypothetical protein
MTTCDDGERIYCYMYFYCYFLRVLLLILLCCNHSRLRVCLHSSEMCAMAMAVGRRRTWQIAAVCVIALVSIAIASTAIAAAAVRSFAIENDQVSLQ